MMFFFLNYLQDKDFLFTRKQQLNAEIRFLIWLVNFYRSVLSVTTAINKKHPLQGMFFSK